MDLKDYNTLLDNIERGKRKNNPVINRDLFGTEIPEDVKNIFNKIFHVVKGDPAKVVWIPGNVIGKKNNYVIHTLNTGRSMCCNAAYDKKTKICTKCGNSTKSGKVSSIGLNEDASKYKSESLNLFIKNKQKFEMLKIKNEPITVIGVFFIRDSNRRFDYDNSKTMICDQLVAAGIISDDSADKVMVLPLGYVVNKEHPGVLLKYISFDNYKKFILSECV